MEGSAGPHFKADPTNGSGSHCKGEKGSKLPGWAN